MIPQIIEVVQPHPPCHPPSPVPLTETCDGCYPIVGLVVEFTWGRELSTVYLPHEANQMLISTVTEGEDRYTEGNLSGVTESR